MANRKGSRGLEYHKTKRTLQPHPSATHGRGPRLRFLGVWGNGSGCVGPIQALDWDLELGVQDRWEL